MDASPPGNRLALRLERLRKDLLDELNTEDADTVWDAEQVIKKGYTSLFKTLRTILDEGCEHPGEQDDVHHLCRTCRELATFLGVDPHPPTD